MSDQVQSQWHRLTVWLHRAKDRTFIASTASLIFLAISVISAFFETPSLRELLFEIAALSVIFVAGRQPIWGSIGVIVGTMLGITTAYRDMPEIWVLAIFTSVGILGSYSSSRQKRISCTILISGFAVGFATDWIVSGNVAVIPVLLLTAIWMLSHLVRVSIDRRLEHLQHQAAVERSTLRTTIARDVHDVASHTMMAVIVQLRVAQKAQLDNKYDIAAARVTSALDAASAALRSLRGLSHVVHSSDSTGNAIALTEFCKQIKNQAAYYDDVSVSHQGDGNVPESTCLAVLRIAQQCLANAAHHAPGGPVSMQLTRDTSALHFVATNKVGIHQRVPSESAGLGLIGMRHRAEIIGGTLNTTVTADQFIVTCWFPIEEAH